MKTTTILISALSVCLAATLGFGVLAVKANTPTPNVVHTLAPTATPVTPVHDTYTSTPNPPAVTISVKATATMRFSPTLTPADFVNIFHLVDPAHGYYATGCTTYLIAHSYAVGYGAPGNAWEKLKPGNIVKYNGSLYQINLVETPGKAGIKSVPVWGACDSHELVMITCKSRGANNPATNNYVIRAEKVS